ncbi:MAG TPA: PQQ-binding-like beta-propeller repeat protein [Acidimicrobiia bacterium]|nr:PQQ-binding-like beta-propeller repeat protein [Acidimicrobiia bacterium]
MRRTLAIAIVTLAGASVLVGLYVAGSSGAEPVTAQATSPSTTTSAAPPTTTAPSTTTTTTTTTPFARFVDPRTVGTAWGVTEGVLQFRGNPTRTWYGPSRLPDNPRRLWRFPDSGMCGSSSVGGETTNWCGTGWTGQPAVWIRPDGITEVVFGAYDKAVHFLDASTGERTRPDFQVGDLIKGSVTIDPDGYPLLYFGSRDNKLRVVALDREQPTELWAIDASEHPGVWNNDWDGNPSIVEDIMFEGGENGILFATKLNRSYDPNGKVRVDPVILVKVEGWNDELFRSVGDRNASIESSVAILNGRLYFTNSGGRVVGLDITNVEAGEAPIVFDFWAGDDIDASPVIDADGMLYLAIELERRLPRSAEVGQIIKLDPFAPDDPLVWSVAVPALNSQSDGGAWATPALGDGVLYVATHTGEVLAIDAVTGDVSWRDDIGFHAWSSPLVIDGHLLLAVDCEAGGGLRAYSLADPRQPSEVWEMNHGGGCIESTPTVWDGTIFVGSRDGYFYAFGDR